MGGKTIPYLEFVDGHFLLPLLLPPLQAHVSQEL